MRERGDSYKMISEKLGLSKSTLSNWLSRVPFKPNAEVIRRVHEATLKSGLHKRKLKFDSIEKAGKQAKTDIGRLSNRDLFMLGIGLYLGEGEKSHENIRIANSDPKIIKLGVKWLYNHCGIKRDNLKAFIHLYPDSNIDAALSFWSRITNIPISQFGKVVIDTRENKSKLRKRKLPYGTLHLKTKSNGNPNLGVYLHRRIMAWIDNCLKQITM